MLPSAKAKQKSRFDSYSVETENFVFQDYDVICRPKTVK